MKRRITYKVEESKVMGPEWISTKKGDHTESTGLHRLQQHMVIPPRPYLVTYTLAEKHGQFLSDRVWCNLSCVVGVNVWFANCLIPTEWMGLRYNRKVTLL